MSETQAKPLLKAAEIRAAEATIRHPWNPRSEVHGTRLGPLAGLARVGVNLARVPAGKESFVPHAHQFEEEWIYVLSGSGTAVIGNAEHAVGPGDFMGFPARSAAHHLKNTGTEDLVYLVGGEVVPVEIVEFPQHGKRTVRVGERIEVADLAAFRPWPG